MAFTISGGYGVSHVTNAYGTHSFTVPPNHVVSSDGKLVVIAGDSHAWVYFIAEYRNPIKIIYNHLNADIDGRVPIIGTKLVFSFDEGMTAISKIVDISNIDTNVVDINNMNTNTNSDITDVFEFNTKYFMTSLSFDHPFVGHLMDINTCSLIETHEMYDYVFGTSGYALLKDKIICTYTGITAATGIPSNINDIQNRDSYFYTPPNIYLIGAERVGINGDGNTVWLNTALIMPEYMKKMEFIDCPIETV